MGRCVNFANLFASIDNMLLEFGIQPPYGLELTQPTAEMSSRNLPEVEERPACP
jgi:hypothetical protein